MSALSALSALSVFCLALLSPEIASAQQAVPGFALERLYRAAPGEGWLVMDALDQRGGLGGAVEAATGYAHDPLHVTSNGQRTNVVSEQAFVDVGIAATYDRFRIYFNFNSPVAVNGKNATVGPYNYAAPVVDLGSTPDAEADFRIGFDTRLYGDPKGPFRVGTSVQLFVNAGDRFNYISDGAYRAMVRGLFAGDIGRFTYAGQLGIHARRLESPAPPGNPDGSELLFGVAAGPKFPLDATASRVLVVGPEIFGETALRSFFGGATTGVEGLLTGRIDGTADDGGQMQVKLGVGGGIHPEFGAPEWRVAFAISLFDHSVDTDQDSISDKNDACPRVPGVRTKDPKTNGCPPAPSGEHEPSP